MINALFSSVNSEGRWVPGIGDPSFLGWLTVFAYFGTAWLCLWAGRSTRGEGHSRKRIFWMVLAGVLLFLGVNKQLDLQSLITQIGKDLAQAQGWYEQRRTVQLIAIATLLVCAGIGLLWIGWLLRGSVREIGVALVGIVFVVTFVLVRASSFQHMDELIDWRILGLRMNWLLELDGIALIAANAWVFRRGLTAPSRR